MALCSLQTFQQDATASTPHQHPKHNTFRKSLGNTAIRLYATVS